jgi:hypothetical protein
MSNEGLFGIASAWRAADCINGWAYAYFRQIRGHRIFAFSNLERTRKVDKQRLWRHPRPSRLASLAFPFVIIFFHLST